MRTTIKAVTVGLLAAGLAVVAPAGVASADPGDPEFSFELDCGEVGTFDLVTGTGNGAFTPAFDIDSNRVFIPVSFGEFSGALYDADTGDLLFEFTDPPETKGSGKQRDTTPCSFTFADEFSVSEEEELDPSDPEYLPAGNYRFEGGGTVVGQIKGR